MRPVVMRDCTFDLDRVRNITRQGENWTCVRSSNTRDLLINQSFEEVMEAVERVRAPKE